MLDKIKKCFKEVKRFMDKKVQMCKDLFASRSNHVAVGVVITCLGVGLVISGYMPLPT